MANTYKNIANMLPTIRQYMLGHVENVKNGNGIITLGDFQEAFTQLETMINDRLRSSFNSRVSITLSNTQTQNSNGVAQQNIQRESKSLKGKKRLTETQLNRVIKESVKRVLRETSLYTDDPYHYAEYYNDYEEPSEEDIISSLNGGPDISPQRKKREMDQSWEVYDDTSQRVKDVSQRNANRMYRKANHMFSKDNPYYRNTYDDDDYDDAFSVINTGDHLYDEPHIPINKIRLR